MSKLANTSALCKYIGKKVLLVEGNTDCHVVMALCKVHEVENDLFGLYDCGSDNQALKRLNALIIATPAERPAIIGLMLDADQRGPESRWQSIKQKLRDKPYNLPDAPILNGTILSPTEPDYPRIGVWLMPNNREVGMLEDFISEMIPAQHLAVVVECLALARESGTAAYKDVHQAKAIVHTYLAWQDEPGHPIGQSITARVLQPTTATSYLFMTWLGSLFSSLLQADA